MEAGAISGLRRRLFDVEEHHRMGEVGILNEDDHIELPLYARAGVPETWIINLPAETVEVHSRPATGKYRETVRAKRGEVTESKVLPSLRLTVDEVLG